MPAVAERPRSQLRPSGDPRDLEPTSKVNGHDPASVVSPAASAPPLATATDALDVGEQIRRLQALAELRAAGILTDGELMGLKRRVLSSGSDAPLEAPRAEISGVSAPVLDRREPKGSYVTALDVVGMIPIVCRCGGNKRPLYVSWKNALDAAAAKAAARARPTSSELFSLRIELRLYVPGGQGSDLDNYVKPIQDGACRAGHLRAGRTREKHDER